MNEKGARPLRRAILVGCFLGALITAGCGEDLKAANEKLKKDVADLTVDNERLRAESAKMRNDLSALHNQVADLNVQVSVPYR